MFWLGDEVSAGQGGGKMGLSVRLFSPKAGI